MPTYTVRAYGAMDFQVVAKSRRLAIGRINELFDKLKPHDPLTGRVVISGITSQGFLILIPERTREVNHGTDPDPRRKL